MAGAYVAGWPLATLGSHASLGSDEGVDIARQLTDAVDAARAAGVVHLRLDASKVKISTANDPDATILRPGSSVIVDAAAGPPEVDRLALARIIQEFGLEP